MATAETLDFKMLAAPVAGPNPAGTDLRAEAGPGSLYYRIKDARTAARAAERRRQLAEPDADPPDWRPVLQHGVEALAGKSKDLEIAAYVVEALTRLHSFAGLRDGFRMTRELIDAFWDGLYPLPDEDGLETRLASLTGLNGADAEGTLPGPVLRVPITDGPAAGKLAPCHYQEARALARIADAKTREKKAAEGVTTAEQFQKAVAETPPAFFRNLVEDLTQCQEEFGKLCAALEQRCGPDHTPPSSNIRNALTNCLDIVKDAAREKLQAAAGQGDKGKRGQGDKGTRGEGDEAPAGSPLPLVPSSPCPPDEVRTREDAFRELLKLADFFRRTEPQAVLSYALEQVVRWGRLSLPELLLELIPEEASRKHLFKHVGIRPETKPEAAKK